MRGLKWDAKRPIPRTVSVLLGGAVLLCAWSAHAQTPACDRLTGSQRELARELLASQHPYACCDDSILACLDAKPTCRLAWRLAENICQRVSRKQDKTKIVRSLSRRARSMLPQPSVARIDLNDLPMAGAPGAPVIVVEYACARCPYCSKITPRLYADIVEGRLEGKAKLYFKTFPIRNHPYSKETGLGFVAAAEQGRFWEFLMYSYEHFDFFCIKKQPEWAEAVGLDPATFHASIVHPATRTKLVGFKKEGIVNKVDATPTFFINGRKYVGDMSPEEMTDVIEEEYERMKGLEYRP